MLCISEDSGPIEEFIAPLQVLLVWFHDRTLVVGPDTVLHTVVHSDAVVGKYASSESSPVGEGGTPTE